jgi:hypothetical protein
MNKDLLRKNIGKPVRFRPPAVTRDGQECDDKWIIEAVDDNVRLRNGRTNSPLILGSDHIQKYTSDPGTGPEHGFLVLDVNVIEKNDGRFDVEPIVRGGRGDPPTRYVGPHEGTAAHPTTKIGVPVPLVLVVLLVAGAWWWWWWWPTSPPRDGGTVTVTAPPQPNNNPSRPQPGDGEGPTAGPKSGTAPGPRGGDKPRDPPAGTPPTAAVPAPTNCKPAPPPDRAPNVTLELGDVIVVGGGEIYRLDSKMKATLVTSGHHVSYARGVTIDPLGRILVSSKACGEGAIVSVDSKSGVQTPLVGTFGTIEGIVPANEEDTVFIGDEDLRKGNVWGYLWRVNLKTREKWTLYEFPREIGAAPTSIGFDPTSGKLYFAAKKIYWMSPEGPRSLSLAASNVQAMAFAATGEMFMAEYDGGPVVQVDLPARAIVKKYQGFPTLWSMAVAHDGKSVFVGSGSAGTAMLVRVPTSGEPAETVWRPPVKLFWHTSGGSLPAL